MVFEIEINNKKYQAKSGETILQALKRNGITIPTLCKMASFSPTGACRLCVVEVEGKDKLVTSCSYPVEEWMKINTHSLRVIKARRGIIELLLANHPDDCLYCVSNGDCELQDLAVDLDIRERIYFAPKNDFHKDKSSAAIERDPSKCIICGRCVRICEEEINVSALDFVHRGKDVIVDTTFKKGLNLSSCISCGQCILVCPTGTLSEKSHINKVKEALMDQNKHSVAFFDPSLSIAFAEEFGLKPGKDVTALLIAALRKLGFRWIFESASGSDISIHENVEEFLSRRNEKSQGPFITSHCPAFVQFVEQSYPERIPDLSTTKSGKQIIGAVSRKYISEKNGIASQDLFTVAITNCTASKYEAEKEGMTHDNNKDLDAVMTSRELLRIIKIFGIDCSGLEPDFPDEPFRAASSAGKISYMPGGFTEAFIRSLYFKMTGKDMPINKISKARNVKVWNVFDQKIGKENFRFAIINGLKSFEKFMDELPSTAQKVDFIEVLVCPGGCINGGGQLSDWDDKKIKIMAKGLYEMDEKGMIKESYKNPGLMEIYSAFFESPADKKSIQLLHTNFSKREVFL